MSQTVALILILLTVSLGPSFVIAMVGFASIQALGRNPSAAPKIQLAMLLAFIFAEAIAVISLLVVFGLFK
ncbi:MAG: ATP synthase F0 subunit C [Planctomycetota bacterium]|nr:ATP synthase F0 subunit C [Planctomycetota bacterium]MDI6787857.1 ATP synthase F0 subunit C [Planctomycetota bacterium]